MFPETYEFGLPSASESAPVIISGAPFDVMHEVLRVFNIDAGII